MQFWKQITEHEKGEYQKWARLNYRPYTDIKGVWHPVVQEECVQMNKETGKYKE